ncbi:hypothetical protein ATH84_10517 [Paracoccus versutus]|uniref:Uncharacterized protein n=1 Tax=Paracoccus versutus TaxID=34007 RepID=A0AAQ0KJJ6_PARVE|nr:hypothetical protein ATH84_10517 [Paracoccus versutus]SFY43841.1 hypothetical protein SAMN04244548_04802 [Paracoccus pantotrophus]
MRPDRSCRDRGPAPRLGLPHPSAIFPLLIGFRANNVPGLSAR